jgi:hypothetical protein
MTPLEALGVGTGGAPVLIWPYLLKASAYVPNYGFYENHWGAERRSQGNSR